MSFFCIGRFPNASDNDLSGKTVRIHHKQYTFHRRIGAGAFGNIILDFFSSLYFYSIIKKSLGAVYSARSHHGRHVAIKVVDISRAGAGPALSKSYLNEVEHLQRLRKKTHHVVHIYGFDFDMSTGRGKLNIVKITIYVLFLSYLAYIVMELGGDNLAKAIERAHGKAHSSHEPGTFIDPVLRQYAWKQMVTIVRTLTENNIVHMDLKPDNLILFGRTIKIADLGISKKADMLG